MRPSDTRKLANAGRITARCNPFANVAAMIGRDGFCSSASQALRQTIKHDIIGAYVISSRSRMRVMFADGGVPANPEFSQIAARRYATDFWRDDPAVRRFLASPARQRPKIRLQRWNEIPGGEYRAFAYERPHMLERISLFKEFGDDSILLSLYRTTRSGQFTETELQSFEGQSDLFTALAIRHCELLRSQAALRPSHDAVAAEIGGWIEPLSPREIEVCAALLCVNSLKHAIRSTGLQPATFITYRKRAFAKLGVSTSEQLAQRYEQRL